MRQINRRDLVLSNPSLTVWPSELLCISTIKPNSGTRIIKLLLLCNYIWLNVQHTGPDKRVGLQVTITIIRDSSAKIFLNWRWSLWFMGKMADILISLLQYSERLPRPCDSTLDFDFSRWMQIHFKSLLKAKPITDGFWNCRVGGVGAWWALRANTIMYCRPWGNFWRLLRYEKIDTELNFSQCVPPSHGLLTCP